MQSPIATILFIVLLLAKPLAASASGECGTQEITPAQLDQILVEGQNEDYLLLDVRSQERFFSGTIPGAINIGKLQEILADNTHQDVENRSVVIVSEDGSPDNTVVEWIMQLCERDVDVWILKGGVQDWNAQGLLLENPMERLTTPGTVPFVVPRGLCEMNTPALEYN